MNRSDDINSFDRSVWLDRFESGLESSVTLVLADGADLMCPEPKTIFGVIGVNNMALFMRWSV